MNYSLEYLIELSKRTGDRLIVHDSVMGEAFVIMPLESYESLLHEKKYSFESDEFEPESDADVLNRINSEIDAWRERQTEEALAEWVDSEDECDDECGDCSDCDDDEIDKDAEPMYHEIIEEPRQFRSFRDLPVEAPVLTVNEPETAQKIEEKPVNVAPVSEVLPDYGEVEASEDDAPWEKFKKMGAPISAEELKSIPETTDFSDINFSSEPIDSEPVFFDEPVR